jgi:hypothetical protein
MGNCLDLFFWYAVFPGGLAVLRKDKLTSRRIACPGNGELSSLIIQLTDTFTGKHTEHTEMPRGVIKYIGHKREDRPPVTRCAGCCAWFIDRVSIRE